jgi:hypothetical protein
MLLSPLKKNAMETVETDKVAVSTVSIEKKYDGDSKIKNKPG